MSNATIKTGARILENVEPDDYHKRDGLSASIATTLDSRSPLHAWAEHPKLGGKDADPEDPSKAQDLGTVGHALVLGKGKQFEVLSFENYTTKAAREARDAARKAGKVPILGHLFERAATAAEAVRIQLADRGIHLDGRSELAVEWYEPSEHGPVLCRAMFDHVWLRDGRILDLKFTHSAAPDAVERSAENFGYAIQQHAYRRALTALYPELAGRVDFLFVFCEPDRPYAVNVCRPDGALRELGETRWTRAVNTWARCLAENKWPAFGNGVNRLSVPAWALKRELERAA